MKTTTVRGKTFECPMYVCRTVDAWIVRVPGRPKGHFSDLMHGGMTDAFRAALVYREALAPITNAKRPPATRERRTKRQKTGTPGIHIVRQHRPARRHHKPTVHVALHITGPNRQRKTLYLGNATTWRKHYAARLRKARQIRREMLQ